ncbi:MAG: DUF4132 domain-containing protein, partial [Planctomycetales bacterium]|nr:DUF4132 domain-containing protein [Planctomycetales bacterium]
SLDVEGAVRAFDALLQSKTSSERGFAAEGLASLQGGDAKEKIRQALKAESAPRTRETLKAILQQLEASADAGARNARVELPPVECEIGEHPLPTAFIESAWKAFEAQFEKEWNSYEKQIAEYEKPDRPAWFSKPSKPEPLQRERFEELIRFVEGRGDEVRLETGSRVRHFAIPQTWAEWDELASVRLDQALRCLKALGRLFSTGQPYQIYQAAHWIESHRNAQSQPYGLRELDATIAALGYMPNRSIGDDYMVYNSRWHRLFDWESDAVWPLFQERSELLSRAISGISDTGVGSYWGGLGDRRTTALRIVGMMPSCPPDVEAAVWGIALGEGKSDRADARKALAHTPDRLARSLAAISDGRQAVRIAGADFLAEIGDPAAIEPLKKALVKEKQELVKGSLLQAIEHLGGDVDEFLGKRKQLNDAKKGLAKKPLKGMEWVPLDHLPRVRWLDDDKPVADEIVRWWVIQSIQFKLPTPGAILKRSLKMCRKDDVAALAKYLLNAFIARDTATPSREDVIAEATSTANAVWNGPHNQWVIKFYGTIEQLIEMNVEQMCSGFLHSANDQKGMLAIVAGGGDLETVKLIERYIRTYHGYRLAQSKALLETLAWIEHSSAVQVLLSIANRFRTKGIRKRADELVKELAERQGWTMDQLADRTIPDGGFAREKDQAGRPIGKRAELSVDYGSRKFTVILDDDLEPVITRDDGKSVKSLPAAAKDDDPELVKSAKKEFSDAKKTVKEVIKSQAERLYEAACTQRVWNAEEWRTYLAEHPIAGALCRRVVWAAYGSDESERPTLFRPLEDGSFTDVNDDEFVLADEASVRVAHSSLIEPAVEQAWKQHLEDYEVPKLFLQFGRPTYRLPKELEKADSSTDFQGHMLTTYKLRSRAGKLGWTRGETLDGGGFSTYHKPFRSLGIEAVLDFTGSYVPEEDLPAAIRDLHFAQLRPQGQEFAYS